MAEHGSVPIELADQDKPFWAEVTSISICDYEQNCDADEKRKQLDSDHTITKEQWESFKEFDRNNGIDPETGEPYECIFIQCAYAAGWTKVDLVHTTYVKIRPSICDNGSGLTCERVTYTTGTGIHNISASGGQNHARTNYQLIQAYSDTVDPAGLNEIKATVEIAGETSYGPVQDLSKAQIYQYVTQGDCGSQNQCGTYTIAGYSPSAYKWVYHNLFLFL